MRALRRSLFPCALLAASGSATLHHLFVGNLHGPASIHALEFDDKALTLNVTNTIDADAAHAWITFDARKQNVYGVSLDAPKLSSYSIVSNSSLRLMQSINSEAACQNRTSAYITARTEAPYIVYTAAWPGPNSCGQAIAVDRNGTMCSVIQVYKYQNESAVQGMTVNDNTGTLYSADLSGDYIWAHSINEHSGALELIQKKKVTKGMAPRHLVTYPSGEYLYVVNENDNSLHTYSVDRHSGYIEDVENNFSLLPAGKNKTKYAASEVILSQSRNMLWASTRPQDGTNSTGYISAFTVSGGRITRQRFTVPSTIGGQSSTMAPAPFNDQWLATVDYPSGVVQIWEVTTSRTNTTLKAVVKTQITDGGCCGNAIWYD